MSPRPRRTAALAAFIGAATLLVAGLAGLGWWQIERRAWKHALIERVEQRVHAPPVPAPGPDDWPHIAAASHEYRRVRLAGRFEHDRETLVQAVTVHGAGFWVLTPLRMADGNTVLVNRGFVPPPRRERATRATHEPQGTAVVTGLLRLSEPGGGFLRANDPASGRWTSRDVAAIAAARGLGPVAPYFVDAEAADGDDPAGPVAGLTVIHFSDPHLGYALTWFALAALVAAGTVAVLRHERRGPR